MPGTCCCVPGCHLRGGHEFPTYSERRKVWINAIRRLDQTTMKTWVPSQSAVVCKTHFAENDYVKETVYGKKPTIHILLPTAVPSIFPWSKQESLTATKRKSRAIDRLDKRVKREESCRKNLEESFNIDVEHREEIIYTAERIIEPDEPATETIFSNMMTQTPVRPMFSVDNFVNDNAGMHFYTGLESFAKFLFVLRTLGPAAYCLRYIYFQVDSVTVENQFFMALMKLRRYTTNFELSRFFSISGASVKNIVYTWIIFMSKQWREADILPSTNLVRYFAPTDFRKKFPTTRIIVDGTECPIKKPKAPPCTTSNILVI